MPTFPTNLDLLTDFASFLRYLESKPTLPLTGAGDLKGTDLYALNERVNLKTPFAVTARSRLADYPLLAFLFEIVTAGRMAVVQYGKVNTLTLDAVRIDAYWSLTKEEQYVFLLETAWCYVDWGMLDGDGRSGHGANWFQQGFREVLKYPVGTPIMLYDSRESKPAPPALFVPFMANIYIRAGEWFGWYDLRERHQPKRDKYSLAFDQLTLTDWGQQCLPVLLHERPFQLWNKQAGDYLFFGDASENDDEPEPVDISAFAELFRGLLDEPELLSLYPINPHANKGVFWLKVELPNHQVSRTIALPATMTLDDLHVQIQDAFKFDDDHLYHFYRPAARLNPRNPYSGEQYICPDEADWSDYPTADSVALAQLNLYVGQRLLYIFDLAESWEFWITVVRHLPDDTSTVARIVEKVGRAPKQYPNGW